MKKIMGSEADLIDQMCTPSDAVRDAVAALDGDIMVLGAAGTETRALSTSVRATYMRTLRPRAQVQTKMRPSNRSVSMPNLDWEESGSRSTGRAFRAHRWPLFVFFTLRNCATA